MKRVSIISLALGMVMLAVLGYGGFNTGPSGGSGGTTIINNGSNFDPFHFTTNAASQITATTNFYIATGHLFVSSNDFAAGPVVLSSTNIPSIFGHMTLKGTIPVVGTVLFDVDLAVDCNTFNSDAPAICQFQGVTYDGAPAKLVVIASTDGAGGFRVRMGSDSFDGFGYDIEITTYGANMPSPSLTDVTEGMSGFDYSQQFVPFDKQIAGNSLMGKSFQVFDRNGFYTPIAFAPNGEITGVGGGIQIGGYDKVIQFFGRSFAVSGDFNSSTAGIASDGGTGVYILGNNIQFSSSADTTAPAHTNSIVKWISVTVDGDTNAYRLPLYK